MEEKTLLKKLLEVGLTIDDAEHVAEILEEVRALGIDANRYRYLRDNLVVTERPDEKTTHFSFTASAINLTTLDKALDSIMEKTGGKSLGELLEAALKEEHGSEE